MCVIYAIIIFVKLTMWLLTRLLESPNLFNSRLFLYDEKLIMLILLQILNVKRNKCFAVFHCTVCYLITPRQVFFLASAYFIFDFGGTGKRCTGMKR